MEILLSEDQALLRDSAAKLLAQAGGVKRARGLRGKGGGFDRNVHRETGAAGWLAVLVPAEHEGLGLGPAEMAIVLEEAGRVLAPEPVAASMLACRAIADSSSAAAREALLGPAMAGEQIIVPAFSSARVGGHGGTHGAAAELRGGRAILTGRVDAVAFAAAADGFLIEAASGDGPLLCHVPRDAEGLVVSSAVTVDGRAFGRLELEGVRASHVLAGVDQAKAADRLFDLAAVAAAAEMAGVMSAAHEATVAYLKERHQFGRPIGSFQALQHRAVDDYAAVSSTRALLYQVCAQGQTITPAMASALKAFAAAACLCVTKSAIQMHGAIGFTDEHDIGLYLKRAMWLSAWLGNEAAHTWRYDRESLD